MKPIQLYTAFHGNLDFSALPEADRALVIARCYWPLLSLPERHDIRIGFEMSARTLLAPEREDPEWLKQFRGLAERGQAALAPMLDFAEVDQEFFCRLTHSAAETDETRATFVRGKRRFGFAIEGYQKGPEDPLPGARLRHLGLVYRTETGVGLTNNF